MPRPAPVIVVLVLALAHLVPSVPGEEAGDAWEATVVAEDLDFPTTLAFGPDGTLYYAELNTGHLRAIPPGASEPAPDPVLTVDAIGGANGGFLGLALDPDFESTGAFYVYYTTSADDGGKENRMSRVTPDGAETVLLTTSFAEMHNGGRLLFVGDQLFVTMGDNEKRDPAQDPESLLGKVLRVDRDGNAYAGNPYGEDNPVYAIGLRNPFGIAWDADAERLWVTNNGPNCCDTVYAVEMGGNYGWPHVKGNHDNPDYAKPVVAYEAPIGPTGATVLDGVLYFGEFNRGVVHRVRAEAENPHNATADVAWELPYSGRILDVEAGPQGRLYVATYDKVYRLDPTGEGPPSPPPDEGDGEETPDGNETDTDQEEGENSGPPSGNGGDDGGGDDATRPDESGNTRGIPVPGVAVAVALLAGVALTRRRAGPRAPR